MTDLWTKVFFAENHRDRYALLLACLLSIILVTYPIFDFDLYWHLANGREMVKMGSIFGEELFSYTHLGEKFANHEWLGQIIFYLVWSKLGPYGLFALKLMLVVLMVIALYRTLRNESVAPGIAALLCVLAVFAGINRYHERPELFSLLGVALLSCVLYSFRAKRLSHRFLWWIPVLLVIWDWLHGAVYGLTFLTLFVVGENAKYWLPVLRQQQHLAKQELAYLNRCFALTMFAMLVNPLGLRSYGIFVGYVIGEADFNQVITEFTPVTWDEFKVFILLFAWTVFLALRNVRRLDVTHVLLMVVFGYAALRFNRVTGVAAIVLVPILASLIKTSMLYAGEARLRWHAATLTTVAVLTLAYGYLVKFGEGEAETGKYHYLRLYDLAFDWHESKDFYPVGSVNFIKSQGIIGNLYNSGNLGGYLAFRITPERKIFQYNMGRVFGDPFYFVEHPERLKKWNINYAIVDTESELTTLFPEQEWAEVYRDAAAILLVKRTAQNEKLIRQYEIHYFYPVLSNASLRARANDAEILPRLAEEMGDSLAYRRDDRIAALWAEILMSHPELRKQAYIQQQLKEALKYNHVKRLEQLVSL